MSALVIAEKPSVARDIARVLHATQKGEGFLYNTEYVVTWALGHLVTQCEPSEIDPCYKHWQMSTLPILPESIPMKVIDRTKTQFFVVKALMDRSDIQSIICATDAGREGELIFRRIYEQAGCCKPVMRLWISSMTDEAIRAGFQSLRPDADYDGLYASARCRSEADWLVGMNASRAFTLRYNVLLSIGRVQTPALAMIVERDRAISTFVPEDYWEIRADFGGFTGLWINPDTQKLRCPTQAQAKAIQAAVQHQHGVVEVASYEEKRKSPPPLYDLTLLQREANKKLGFSAERTLNTAQSLYEKYKCVTYPRTDSRYLPKDMMPKVAKILKALRAPYAAWVEAIEDDSPALRWYDDARVTDHHAIIPTNRSMDVATLPSDERALYDMIARRLIAVHYPDYVYESAQIIARVQGHAFKATGTTPIHEGWREVYAGQGLKGIGADEDTGDTLPRLNVGDPVTIHKATIKAMKTKPPTPHTDATLLKFMEDAGKKIEDEALREAVKTSGLGTPATRAAIIERLLQVGYIERRGKTLVSTEKGRALAAVAPDMITSAEMTGKWERALNRMRETNDPDVLRVKSARFIESIQRFSTYLVDTARTSTADVVFPQEDRKQFRAKPSTRSTTPEKRRKKGTEKPS